MAECCAREQLMTDANIESVANALVVGGGIGGMATAIALASRGVSVDLIDIDPEWRVYGAGITITGPTLRAYHRLGMVERIRSEGAVTNKSRIRLYDGTVLRELEEPVIEAGLPATGGIMRPVLHRIMQDDVRSHDIPVRLGVTVSALSEAGDRVDVTFSDGTCGAYDIVIGADSVSSGLRKLAYPHMADAAPTGQGCWRISTRKPPQLDMGEFYFGGENPAGITICGPDNVYMWMLTPHIVREKHMDEAELYAGLKSLLAPFGGNAGWIRDTMAQTDWINYRPLAAALQPKPWFNGRVVLLGDAVHATTPHLASGAGMAVESAIVLAEELAKAPDVPAAFLAYQERRFARCADVVETSISIGRLQLEHGPPDQVAGLIEGALARLNQPF